MRLAAAVLCAALALPAAVAAEEEIGIGLPAPSFSLRTMNAEAAGTGWLALDRFAGEAPEDDGSKLVILSFFASWCGPCKKEMPFLAQLDKMYRDQGLRIIGVCIDKEEPGLSTAKKMISDNKVTYPVVSDRFNFLARRYLGESAPLPSVFLVRRDGNIARIERGYSKDVGGFLLAAIQQELGLTVTAPAAKVEDAQVTAETKPEAKPEPKSKSKSKPKAKAKARQGAVDPGPAKSAVAEPTPPKS